jgi:predicted dinucleotide-binding enzyme
MYVIIVGAGKVGWNLARELLDKGHEVTLMESDRERFAAVEQELDSLLHSELLADEWLRVIAALNLAQPANYDARSSAGTVRVHALLLMRARGRQLRGG